MYLRRNILFVILSACIACSFFACDDNSGPADNTTSRLFRPAYFTVDAGSDPIVFTWMPVSNATYLLEICRDQTFEDESSLISKQLGSVSSFVITIDEIRDKIGFVLDVYYEVRIKSISSNPNVKDSEYATARFKFVSP
jgi:hypothetical protein